METWFIILISLCISALIKAFINLVYSSKIIKNQSYKLPPGPSNIPVIANFLLVRKSLVELTSIIRVLHQKYGPLITLPIGSRPSIVIADRSLIHQALIHNPAVFASRPPATAISRVISSQQHNINTAAYGPTWRFLRRNLTSQILSPPRVKSYWRARKWVLQILLDRLNSQAKNGDHAVRVFDNFLFVMFSLLVLMCFGDKLDKNKITEVEDVQRLMVLNLKRFNVLNFWPNVTKILFSKLWQEFCQIRKKQEEVLLQLIRERRKMKEERLNIQAEDDYVLAYVDTLFDLQLPEEKRKLDENEIMSLCSEFLDGGTATTTTSLQWVMANLVKYPHVQEKLFKEIKGVVGEAKRHVTEDDLLKMPYLKAVILETLRRHPPFHFLSGHAVTDDDDTVFGGYLFPKNATLRFMLVDIGRDPKIWDDPMGFKPERFLNNEQVPFDIRGSSEIKMMPFGVGRRMCPGLGLAMLHLKYVVANLIWCYEWKAADGDEVDLDEKQEFTMVMKTPLKAQIHPRSN